MIRKKDAIKLLLALLLIAVIIFSLYKKKYFTVLEKVSISDFLTLALFILLSYFTSGFQLYYLVKKQNNISIGITDTLFLPVSMNLFSYVIPANGGLLYSVFFFKKKYNIDTSKSFSIGIFSVYISFIITGIFGVVSCIYTKNYNVWILLISFVLVTLSFIIKVLNKSIQKLKFKGSSLITRVKLYIDRVVVHSDNLITDRGILFTNILINVIYLSLTFISYQWVNIILEINMPLTSIFVIILITRISSLIRLLPGNLGLEEIYTGGIFKIIGKDPGIGFVFSLILRFISIMVFIPLGISHTIFNLKYFKLRDLINIQTKVRM